MVTVTVCFAAVQIHPTVTVSDAVFWARIPSRFITL